MMASILTVAHSSSSGQRRCRAFNLATTALAAGIFLVSLCVALRGPSSYTRDTKTSTRAHGPQRGVELLQSLHHHNRILSKSSSSSSWSWWLSPLTHHRIGRVASASSTVMRLSPLFLSAEAATNEVVLCLNGEIVYTLALWAARRVNSTWPTVPAYPGNRTELGFRMDVPIRVKSIPYSSLSVTGIARWHAINGTDCNVIIGPGWSGGAFGIAGLITNEQMWVDPDASSDVLSDKAVYPSFSRIVTPDSQRTNATVRLLNRIGLNHLAIICVRESWSQDLVASISAMWRNQNPDAPAGALLSIKCMADQPPIYTDDPTMANDTSAIPDATMSEWDSVIATISSSRIRTVFVAFRMPLGNPHQFLRRLNATRPDLVKERVFVFADTLCGEGGGSSLPFPGALCLSPAVRANALPEYSTRSSQWQTQDKAYYAAVGVPLKDLNSPGAMTEVQTYHAKVYDSTVLALDAMYKYRSTNVSNRRVQTEYPRLITVPNGLTGELSLTSTGDRRSMKTYVYNSNAASSEMEVGYVESDIHYNAAELFLAEHQGVVPSALLPLPPTPAPAPLDETSTILVVALSCALILVLIVVVPLVLFLLWSWNRARNPRDLSKAPQNEDKEFTLVLTDIQSSATLWALLPQLMSQAVGIHHVLVRRLIAEHSGYEVKTVGESFMVAFKEADDAVLFAIDCQEQLFHTLWGTELFDNVYRNTTDCELTTEEYEATWRGLRVQAGIHTGKGNIVLDPTTNAYDYYGDVVATTTRIQAVAHGGQVLASEMTMRSLSLQTLRNIRTLLLGPQAILGDVTAAAVAAVHSFVDDEDDCAVTGSRRWSIGPAGNQSMNAPSTSAPHALSQLSQSGTRRPSIAQATSAGSSGATPLDMNARSEGAASDIRDESTAMLDPSTTTTTVTPEMTAQGQVPASSLIGGAAQGTIPLVPLAQPTNGGSAHPPAHPQPQQRSFPPGGLSSIGSNGVRFISRESSMLLSSPSGPHSAHRGTSPPPAVQVSLTQLLPASLSSRRFPPLRLETAAHGDRGLGQSRGEDDAPAGLGLKVAVDAPSKYAVAEDAAMPPIHPSTYPAPPAAVPASGAPTIAITGAVRRGTDGTSSTLPPSVTTSDPETRATSDSAVRKIGTRSGLVHALGAGKKAQGFNGLGGVGPIISQPGTGSATPVSAGPATPTRSDPQQRFARALLSTLPVEEQARTVRVLAKRWQVPVDTESELRMDEGALDIALGAVVAKVARSLGSTAGATAVAAALLPPPSRAPSSGRVSTAGPIAATMSPMSTVRTYDGDTPPQGSLPLSALMLEQYARDEFDAPAEGPQHLGTTMTPRGASPRGHTSTIPTPTAATMSLRSPGRKQTSVSLSDERARGQGGSSNFSASRDGLTGSKEYFSGEGCEMAEIAVPHGIEAVPH